VVPRTLASEGRQVLTRLRAGCAALLLAMLLLSPGGCTSNTVVIGLMPDVSLLETRLQLGRSTPDEVRRQLGPPSGKGRTMMPALDAAPRDYWSYFYNVSHIEVRSGTRRPTTDALDYDSRHIFLFVYFENGVYDGYMWFSSLPDHIESHAAVSPAALAHR